MDARRNIKGHAAGTAVFLPNQPSQHHYRHDEGNQGGGGDGEARRYPGLYFKSDRKKSQKLASLKRMARRKSTVITTTPHFTSAHQEQVHRDDDHDDIDELDDSASSAGSESEQPQDAASATSRSFSRLESTGVEETLPPLLHVSVDSGQPFLPVVSSDYARPGAIRVDGFGNGTSSSASLFTNNVDATTIMSRRVTQGPVMAEIVTDEELRQRLQHELWPDMVVAEDVYDVRHSSNGPDGHGDTDGSMLPTNQANPLWRHLTLCVLLAVVIFVSIGLATGLFNVKTDNSQKPNPIDRLVHFQSLLFNNSVSGSALSKESSPQHMALSWLANNDTFVLPTTAQLDDVVARFVMATLYFSTNGTNWMNQYKFLSDQDVCDWHNLENTSGVFCESKNHITRVSLENNALQGLIPSELGNLEFLDTLSLPANTISGFLPIELGNLDQLRTISLGGNQITGRLPTQLAVSVRSIDLHSNRFSGPLPTTLGNLTQLTYLDVSANWLIGTVPAAIASLTNLATLSLYSNQLTGDLTPFFCNQSNSHLSHPHISNFAADCFNSTVGVVVCPCCTKCCKRGNDCHTFTRTERLQMIFFEESVSGYALYINSSPSYKALQWLAENASTALPQTQASLTEIKERFTMATLYFSTNGPRWSNSFKFLSGVHVCDWNGNNSGVICNSEKRIEGVILCNNSLQGPIPPELGRNLALLLNTLDLSHNKLTGSIPTELGNLNGTVTMSFGNNQLRGSLPSHIGLLTKLTKFSLSYNQLQGPIPNEIGNMTLMEAMHFDSNRISGTLPNSLALLTKLSYLDVSSNLLNGTVPTALASLSSLGTLYLSFNNLTGNLTSFFCNQTRHNIVNFEADCTNSTASFVNCQCCTKCCNRNTGECLETDNLNRTYRFQQFLFQHSISGESLYNTSLPSYKAVQWLANHSLELQPSTEALDVIRQRFVMATLYFSTNGDHWTNQLNFLSSEDVCSWHGSYNFSGVFCDTNNEAIERVILGNNSLQGSIPSEIGKLTSLFELSMPGNIITGSIPSELGNLKVVKTVSLGNNELTGFLPTEIGRLQILSKVLVHSNHLKGSIPTELGLLTSLEAVDLGANQLSNTLPSSLGKLTLLTNLDVSSNLLTGSVPENLASLTRLQTLSLFSNSLTGDLTIVFCNQTIQHIPYLAADCLNSTSGTLVCPCCTVCCRPGSANGCQNAARRRV